MKNLRIAELIFNRPLMIAESKLNLILHVLGPRFNLDLGSVPAQQAAVFSDQDRQRSGYNVQEGVATIGIYGPLMHRVLAGEFPSGGPTTYGEVRRSFDTALADDGVSAVVLEIDSPGGMVSGAFDLADHIYQSRAIKPITAIVNESAFSAGYLLASAAERIIVPRTGEVGSIGVIATHADFSKAESAAGITVTHIYAGAKKADGSPHRPLGEEAAADWLASVQSTYDLFVETIARNRNMSVNQVRATEAAIYKASQAVDIGLVDEVSTAATGLASARATTKNRIITASAEPIGKEMHTMTLEELKTNHPDLCQALMEAGRTAGAAAELARIKGIEEACAIPGHEQLVATLKFDGQTTAADAALQILSAEKQIRAGALAAMQQSANQVVPAVETSATGETGEESAPADDAPVEERAAHNWKRDPGLKAEFTSQEAYTAFMRTQESGRTRILNK